MSESLPAPTASQVKDLRRRLNLSQEKFAERYGFGLDSVQSLEQANRTPGSGNRTLLHMIMTDSETVDSLIGRVYAGFRRPK